MTKASIVYYSDGRAPASILAGCRSVLTVSARISGATIVERCGADDKRTHSNIYRKILSGLDDVPDNGPVFLAEHDVLYPPGYFDLRALPDGVGYNTNIVILTMHGFFPAGAGMRLSNAVGRRDDLRCAIERKLDEAERGTVVWAEPYAAWWWSSDLPTVDVRGTWNFTGTRTSEQYSESDPYWGPASAYYSFFGLQEGGDVCGS